MENFVLIDNTARKVEKDFFSYEFFYPDYPDIFKNSAQPFYLRKDIILAAQCIRNFYKTPINITSVHRPHPSQLYHNFCMAFDFQFNFNRESYIRKDFENRITCNSFDGLLLQLLELNIRGYGFSRTHTHLDLRNDDFNMHTGENPYCIFNE